MVTKGSMLLGPAGEIMTLHQLEHWLNLDHGQVFCAVNTLRATGMLFLSAFWGQIEAKNQELLHL